MPFTAFYMPKLTYRLNTGDNLVTSEVRRQGWRGC